MADSAALLRMLEPTVRPVQTPGPSKPPALPVEQRPFESLLAEAHQRDSTGAPSPADPGGSPGSPTVPESADAAQAEASPSSRPLAPLHGLEQVENASLRQLMARSELTAGGGSGATPSREQEREQA